MGEKKVLTEEMIDQKMAQIPPREIRFVDPMKMPMWSLRTACELTDNAVSEKTLVRAISDGSLNGYRAGLKTCVVPAEFLVWVKKHKV